MSIFGLRESEVGALVRAVSRENLDRDGIVDRFARAAWGLLAEPGDGDAGRLTTATGVAPALELLTSGAPPEVIDRAYRDAGGDGDGFAEPIQRWRPRLESGAALRALQQAARFAAALVTPGDSHWPDALDDLGSHAPFGLWVRGDPAILSGLGRSIALVGARAATGYGEHVTIEAASALADRRIVVVSGAAYGIDGTAHRAALASGGPTIAFLAGGVDRYYPSGHETLLSRIAELGAVVSEVPCGTAPTKWRFLQRNRLIAAAAAATVVVEAGWRSGSLNTAGHAAALGRPLGAVPGPVTSSASAGCHRMLREFGAVCVTSAAEMAELVPGVNDAPDLDLSLQGPSVVRTRVLDALSATSARPIERIAALAGLAPFEVRSELALLELDGLVRESPRGWRKSP